MSSKEMKIAILGAGITGLTIARLLNESGYEIEVYEKEDKIGGLCRSEIVQGFVYDIGGGHVIYSKDKDVLKFMLDILGEENTVKNIRNTKIFYKGNYVKYPFENGLGDLQKEDNFECLVGYIKAEFVRQMGARPPENFKEWIYYHFGKGIAEKFMLPYNEKIWKANLSEMSVDWVQGRVPHAPLEDVVRSSLNISTEGYTHQSLFFYPKEGGIQTFVELLVEPIRAEVLLNAPVKSVVKDGKRWLVNEKAYDKVISSIPIHNLIPLLRDVPQPVIDALYSLRFNSMVSFLIGIDEENISPYSWIYLPDEDNGPCHKITYLSNYSPNNAPRGKSSILAEVTLKSEDKIKIDEEFLVESLHRNKMLQKSKVEFVEHRKIDYAYIIYDLNYQKNTSIVYNYLDGYGIDTIGRFARFKYINMDQAIKEAIEYSKKYETDYCNKHIGL